MSATHSSTDSHGHAASGADHVPHVLPLPVYVGVYAMLLVFTALTVGVSYVDMGDFNLVVALLVAACKGLMVGLIFMHLAFDKKINAVIFSLSIVFLAIFIGITMADTEGRGLGGRVSGDRPADVTNPFGGTQAEAEIRRAFERTGKPPAPVPPAQGTEGGTPSPTGSPIVPRSADQPGAAPGTPNPTLPPSSVDP